MKPPLIIPPIDGWKAHTVYHVEASFSPGNPVHGYLFFSGFLNGPKKTPGGYNEFYGTEGATFNEVYYLRVIRTIITQREVERVPGADKWPPNSEL